VQKRLYTGRRGLDVSCYTRSILRRGTNTGNKVPAITAVLSSVIGIQKRYMVGGEWRFVKNIGHLNKQMKQLDEDAYR